MTLSCEAERMGSGGFSGVAPGVHHERHDCCQISIIATETAAAINNVSVT
jgi:hypothetical protein